MAYKFVWGSGPIVPTPRMRYGQFQGHQDPLNISAHVSPWRAVNYEGEVLKVFATKRQDRKAALKLLKRAMTRYGGPHSIVTDRLRVIPRSAENRWCFGSPGMWALAQ